MIVYRLSKKKYCEDLSGKGAELIGRRWNSKGVAMLYTAESRALCVLEIAVHMPLGLLPDDFFMITIELPENALITQISTKVLPHDWNNFPNGTATQEIGNQFVSENKFLAMKVPSAAVQGDNNVLINPRHPMFGKVKIKEISPFTFDDRLFFKK